MWRKLGTITFTSGCYNINQIRWSCHLFLNVLPFIFQLLCVTLILFLHLFVVFRLLLFICCNNFLFLLCFQYLSCTLAFLFSFLTFFCSFLLFFFSLLSQQFILQTFGLLPFSSKYTILLLLLTPSLFVCLILLLPRSH